MKLTQKLLVGAVASLFATVGMAKGTLVYCSEGSPAGFDSAQYTAGTDFDASSYNVFNGLVDRRLHPRWRKAGMSRPMA